MGLGHDVYGLLLFPPLAIFLKCRKIIWQPFYSLNEFGCGLVLWVMLITGGSAGTGRGISASTGGIARVGACDVLDCVLGAAIS